MRNVIKKCALTIAFLAAATLLRWILRSHLSGVPYILYYPMIILAARYGYGIFATFLSTVLAQYFFVEPAMSWAFSWYDDGMRIILFFVSGCMITKAVDSLVKAKVTAQEAAHRLGEERELRNRLMATLTHDLRSPLTAAKASAQLLYRYPEKTSNHERLTHRIIDNIDRADRMLQDLLDSSRIRAGEPLFLPMEYCDLANIVQEVAEELSLVHGDRFILNIEERVSGYWNKEGLKRVLENLASNGLKYGTQGTSVTLALKAQDAQVELSVHNQADDETVLDVELEELTEPFRRKNRAQSSTQPGWGLGLTLVKGITQAHGGTLQVSSSCHEGTTFRICLPRDSRTVYARVG